MKKTALFLFLLALLCGLCLSAPAEGAALPAPVLKKAVSTSSGIRLTWKKVKAATGYIVYRREDGTSSYTKLKTVRAVGSFTDASAEEGRAYQYRVAALRKTDGKTVKSKKSKPLTGARFAEVAIRSVTGQSADSVRLKWTASPGARYDVRASLHGRDKWTTLKKNASKKAFTAKKLKNKVYDFVVVPKIRLKDGTWLEGPPSAPVSARPVAPAALREIRQTASGVKLGWDPVTAGGYTIYRAEDDGEMIRLAGCGKAAVSWTDKAAPGHTYTYRVEAWRRSGGVTSVSALSAPLSLYVLDTPAAPELTLTQRQQLFIRWGEIPGADGYEVNVRFPEEDAGELFFETSDSWIYHDDLLSGIAYRYRVRAFREEGGEKRFGPWSPESEYTLERVYRALLVGNTYSDGALPPLPGPGNDVQGMRAMLERMKGTDYAVTLRRELTADGILGAIADAFADAQSCDVSLFYFSGHGHDAEPIHENGALVGTDGGTVTPQKLRGALDAVPGIKIVLLDSCYSGAQIGDYSSGEAAMAAAGRAVIRAFRGPSAQRSWPGGRHVRTHAGRVDSGTLVAEGYLVITACSLSEEALSVSLPGSLDYAGLMTDRLLYGSGWDIRSGAALPAPEADTDGDGVCTFSEVAAYTEREVRTWAFQLGYAQSVMRYPLSSGEALWSTR